MTGQHKSSLRQRVIAGSSVTLIGYAAGQVMRLASNLILARLLFPEAFGLMAILQSILVGVVLLTDVGLTVSVVRSKRGDTPEFLNTIWTLQILKGMVVGAVLLVIARPAAAYYGNAELAQMIAFTSLTALLQSCRSTKVDLAQRKMQFKSIVVIELAAKVFQFIVTVALAWSLESVWALVYGNAAQAGFYVLLTHFLLDGPRNKPTWSSGVVREVFGFSAWIMLTSFLTYLCGEGLTLLRAKFMPIEFLGQYSIAAALALLGWLVIQKLSNQVLSSAYAETFRLDPSLLPQRVRKGRRIQLLLGWVSCTFFVFFGQWIIELLYDQRYATAGKIIQVLAMSLSVSLLSATYAGVPEVLGKPKISALLLTLQGSLYAAGIVAGGYYFGPWGVVFTGMFVGICLYPIVTYIYGSLGFKDRLFDALGFLLFFCLAAFVYWRFD